MARVVDMSGEYYDWTKTMQPETPWKRDYNKTLVIKIFLCSRDGQGNVGKVYLKFQEASLKRKITQCFTKQNLKRQEICGIRGCISTKESIISII